MCRPQQRKLYRWFRIWTDQGDKNSQRTLFKRRNLYIDPCWNLLLDIKLCILLKKPPKGKASTATNSRSESPEVGRSQHSQSRKLANALQLHKVHTSVLP